MPISFTVSEYSFCKSCFLFILTVQLAIFCFLYRCQTNGVGRNCCCIDNLLWIDSYQYSRRPLPSCFQCIHWKKKKHTRIEPEHAAGNSRVWRCSYSAAVKILTSEVSCRVWKLNYNQLWFYKHARCGFFFFFWSLQHLQIWNTQQIWSILMKYGCGRPVIISAAKGTSFPIYCS